MSFSEILKTAAFSVLLPPGGDENARTPDGLKWLHHKYSCNAVLFASPNRQPTPETIACRDWYYDTVLCADRFVFPASLFGVDDSAQETRFMLLLFASYLAEDLGI